MAGPTPPATLAIASQMTMRAALALLLALALGGATAQGDPALARSLLERGDVSLAIIQARQALATTLSQADTAEAAFVLSRALWLQGQAAEALEHAENAVTLRPQNAEYLWSLALILGTVGRTAEAIDRLSAAIAIGSEVRFLVDLGGLHLRAGEFDPAANAFAQAARLDRANPWPLISRGVALVLGGRHPEARPVLAQALDLLQASLDRYPPGYPAYAEAYYWRALTFIAAGLNREARADLEAAIAVNPEHVLALEALRGLAAR